MAAEFAALDRQVKDCKAPRRYTGGNLHPTLAHMYWITRDAVRISPTSEFPGLQVAISWTAHWLHAQPRIIHYIRHWLNSESLDLIRDNLNILLPMLDEVHACSGFTGNMRIHQSATCVKFYFTYNIAYHRLNRRGHHLLAHC